MKLQYFYHLKEQLKNQVCIQACLPSSKQLSSIFKYNQNISIPFAFPIGKTAKSSYLNTICFKVSMLLLHIHGEVINLCVLINSLYSFNSQSGDESMALPAQVVNMLKLLRYSRLMVDLIIY